MTKRLILIRHAKSSWDDSDGDDHARVLNPRGRKSAAAIGEWMDARGHLPEVVLCSDAARTQETAGFLLPKLSTTPALKLAPLLYHAAPDTVIELIGRETAQTIAVIGHNPGIGMTAHAMVRSPPNHARFDDYPTCATTVIDFDADHWVLIEPRSGKCVDFVVPRDLIGAGKDID